MLATDRGLKIRLVEIMQNHQSQVSIVEDRALVLWRVQVIVGLEGFRGSPKTAWAPKASAAGRPSAHHAPSPARLSPAHHGRVYGWPAAFLNGDSNEGAKRTSTCVKEAQVGCTLSKITRAS